MKKFILSTDNKDLTIKLLIFYILNITDILFTQYLLLKSPDIFVECNIFLRTIVTEVSGIALKLIVPLILIIYWIIRMKNATAKDYKLSNIAVLIIIILYTGINILHLFNMGLFVYMG